MSEMATCTNIYLKRGSKNYRRGSDTMSVVTESQDRVGKLYSTSKLGKGHQILGLDNL